MTARQYLENALDCASERVTHRQLSDITGVCTTRLSRYFSGAKDLPFADWLKVAQAVPDVDGAVVVDLLTSEYIADSRPANKRALLLHLLAAGRYDRVDELVATLPTCRECSAWASLIDAFCRFQRGELGDFELSEYVSSVTYANDELTALKYVLVAYDMRKTESLKLLAHVTGKARQAMALIKNEYIRGQVDRLLAATF